MSQKNYVSLSKLSTFLNKLEEKFSALKHTHKLNEIDDYAIDSTLSPSSTNPVQNNVIDAEFEAVSQAMLAMDLAIDNLPTEEMIPNLYVWKKYDSNPDDIKEEQVSYTQLAWRLSYPSGSGFVIDYSEDISTDGGVLSLVDKQYAVVYNAEDANVLLGKHIFANGSILGTGKGYYFIPEDATFTISGSGNTNLYVSKATKLSIPQYLSYVASKSFNTYTTGAQHTDGYWYKYIKQIGDSAVVDSSSVNFTETDPTVPAWAKAASKPSYTKSEVGLGNVDNTSDANKPVSTAQASAIAEAKSAGTNAQSNLNTHTSNKSNPHGVTKAQVGLGNVDNVKQYSANNPPPYPVTSINNKTGAVTLDASSVGALPSTTVIPKNLADLTADSTHRLVTDTEKAAWNAKANVSAIPTKVSQLTNDSKFLTSFTESDPTVPAWAKEANKPSYTKSEIGLSNVDNVRQYSVKNPPIVVQTEAPEDTNVLWLDTDDNSGNSGGNYATEDWVKNQNYLTELDKPDIVAMVIESLGGNPVFGYVDQSNNIIVKGDLPDGTYTVKYKMEDGNTVNIGNLVLDTNVYYTVTNNLTQCTSNNSATQAVQGGSYSATITANSGYELKSVTVTMGGSPVTVSGGNISIANVTGNIVITAVAEEVKANYTNLFDPSKATLNTRLNSSSAVTATDGYVLTNFMDVSGKTPFTADTKIYMKGVNISGDGSSRIFVYDNTGTTYTGAYGIVNANTLSITDEGNGVISVNNLNSYFKSNVVRACMCLKVKSSAITASDIENIVITIDEPIV